MFGYFNSRNSDSFRKISGIFKKYYCSTCKAIEYNYGHMPRMLLSNDVALLALFLGLKIKNVEFNKRKTYINCGKFPDVSDNCEWKAIAALNILLFAGKLDDDIRDDKSIAAKTAYRLYLKTIRQARTDFPQMSAAITEGYKKIVSDEQSKSKAVAIANDFGIMMENAISSVFSLTKQQSNVIRVIAGWIYIIDALDDYDKDIKSGHFNPFFIENKPFEQFVLDHYKKVKATISEILGAYRDFDEEGFNYYQLNVVLNEFIPEVTYKILTGKRLREIRIFPRKRLAFENTSLPYIGLKINIEILRNSNNIADYISDFLNSNESLCEESIRLNFISVCSKTRAERIIKKILVRLDSLLSAEIRQSISISYERKNEITEAEGSFSDFKNWLFYSNAERSYFYTDFIRQMLYGYSNICEYNSCLGRIFCIDTSSAVYACEKKLMPIAATKPIDENINLIEILEKSVSRRERCKNQCDVFDYCGGGCPALYSEKADCVSQSTSDLFINGKKIINEILRDNSLPLLNKYAQDVFLEFAAYRYGEEKVCLG